MADRIESQLAIFLSMFASAHGSSKKPEDFLLTKKKESLEEKIKTMFGAENGI